MMCQGTDLLKLHFNKFRSDALLNETKVMFEDLDLRASF